MSKSNRAGLAKLNRYSWSLIITFFLTALAMQYEVAHFSFEAFFQVLPLIAAFVYWCEKSTSLLVSPENKLRKAEIYRRDVLILSLGFMLGCLISLILSYQNSDARGWWSLIIYLSTLYGLLYASIFSAAALLIKNHKDYTLVFSLLIISTTSLGTFFPPYVQIPYIGNIDSFYLISVTLLSTHILFAVIYSSILSFLKSNHNS